MSNIQIRRINNALVECIKCKELLIQQENITTNLELLVAQLDTSNTQLKSINKVNLEHINILKDSLQIVNNELLKTKQEVIKKETEIIKHKRHKRTLGFTTVLLIIVELFRN